MKWHALIGAWPIAAATGVGAAMFVIVQLLFPVTDLGERPFGGRTTAEPPPRVIALPDLSDPAPPAASPVDEHVAQKTAATPSQSQAGGRAYLLLPPA